MAVLLSRGWPGDAGCGHQHRPEADEGHQDVEGPSGSIGRRDRERGGSPEACQDDSEAAHQATWGSGVAHRPRQHSAVMMDAVPRTIGSSWPAPTWRPSRTPAATRTPGSHSRPFVSLLSDFGLRDPSAGIMRAVVAGICPAAIVVDLAHEVDKFAIRDGALLLWSAVPYLPIGAHVAVVDPGVGTARKGIAIQTLRGDYLVGPDNGLLMPAAARLGGITRAHLLENPRYSLPEISSSFHGRDVFAPAAAHLADGVAIEQLGRAVDPRRLAGAGVAAPGHPARSSAPARPSTSTRSATSSSRRWSRTSPRRCPACARRAAGRAHRRGGGPPRDRHALGPDLRRRPGRHAAA